MASLKDRLEITALVAEITAALGVIISVIYLAAQVGDNSAALRSQSYANALSQFNTTNGMLVADPLLADIYERGLADAYALTPAEWTRLSTYLLIAFNTWEYVYYLREDGSVPEQLWEGGNAYFAELAASSSFDRFWQETKFAYAEPFHSYVDQYFMERPE